MSTVKLGAALLVILALLLPSPVVRAETQNCTAVTSLPAFITVQGIYCFTGNLSSASTTGAVIQIQTNNVVLDLNGYELNGLAAGTGTTAIGIYANNRQNVTIKNGKIRGFGTAIVLTTTGQSKAHIVEDIYAGQNTIIGFDVRGDGSIVRNNQVVATGGTSTTADANAVGIQATCADVRLLNNDVVNVVKQGNGIAWGIVIFDAFCGNGGMAVGNRITSADRGIEFNGTTGKYFNNTTFNVATPYTGGTDAGNNN